MKLFLQGALSEISTADRRDLLRRLPDEPEGGVRDTVASILERVRVQGDAALLDLALELDGVELASLEVPKERWEAALDVLAPPVVAALRRARDNIAAFHRAQLAAFAPTEIEVEPGVRLERRWAPLSSVGVYAPGGTAAYPSSVLMGVVPAAAAGVQRIVVCSPPGPHGTPPDAVLAAACLGGASRLFAVGGAGAVAAMAFGTSTVPAVDAIVGPGNAWVTEAKRQVAGTVRIDAPAGPSELLVVADDSADPELVALELIAQAEHDGNAVVGLVTTSDSLLSGVWAALERLVPETPRADVVGEALERRGFLLRVASLPEALTFAEAFAAEHLAVLTRDAERDAGAVRSAGSIFVGSSSSVAFGDYMTGANHVLPTAGLARAYSGLSVEHMLRSYTLQRITPSAAAALARPVAALAEAEGLPGHAAAALARRPS